MTTRSADIDFLTLRNVTAYNKNNAFVPPGNIFSVSTNGTTIWTSSIPSLYVSSLSASSISASSIIGDNIEVSTINRSGNQVVVCDSVIFNSAYIAPIDSSSINSRVIEYISTINDTQPLFGYMIDELNSINNFSYGGHFSKITGNSVAIGHNIGLVSTTGVAGQATGINIGEVYSRSDAYGFRAGVVQSVNGTAMSLKLSAAVSRSGNAYGIHQEIVNTFATSTANAYGYYISSMNSLNNANALYIGDIRANNNAHGLYIGNISSGIGQAYGIYQASSSIKNVFQSPIGIKTGLSTLRGTVDVRGNQYIGPHIVTNNNANALYITSTVINSPFNNSVTARGTLVEDTVAISSGGARGIEVKTVTANTREAVGVYIQNITGANYNSYGTLIADVASNSENSYGAQISNVAGYINSYGEYINDITASNGYAYGLYIDNIVAPNALAYGIYQANSSVVNYFSGYVGINNNVPDRELCVTGDATISGNIGTSSIVANAMFTSSIAVSTISTTTNMYYKYEVPSQTITCGTNPHGWPSGGTAVAFLSTVCTINGPPGDTLLTTTGPNSDDTWTCPATGLWQISLVLDDSALENGRIVIGNVGQGDRPICVNKSSAIVYIRENDKLIAGANFGSYETSNVSGLPMAGDVEGSVSMLLVTPMSLSFNVPNQVG